MSPSAHLIQMFAIPRSCARICRQRAQEGARRSSPRPLAWRPHDQDPRKGGRPRRPDRLRSDRRRSLGLHPLRDPARHIPWRRHCRQACPELVEGGYSSKANRAAARTRGIAPVIPHKADEKNKPGFFARTLYKARGRSEQGFGRLKRFKRVALRCEKTAENYRSIVSFAAGLCLIKFVHTA
jgi:transposase